MPEETVPCPGCAAPMGLDQEVCPACRRPRDETEIQRGRDQLRERAEKRRRRPLVAARWALAAAALVLAYRQRQFFIGLTSGLRDEVHQEMKNAETGPKTPQTAMGAAAVAMLGGPPAARSTAPAVADLPAERLKTAPVAAAAPPPPAATQIAVHPKEPKEPEGGAVRLYGVVYDMKSLRPIVRAAVKVSLAGLGSSGIEVRTDEAGRYQIDFIPTVEQTGSVSVSADGYRDGQIEDLEASYLQRPLKERLDVIGELTPTDLEPVPLRYRSTDTLIPLDLVLMPEDAPAAK